jgi:hypothetical protein
LPSKLTILTHLLEVTFSGDSHMLSDKTNKDSVDGDSDMISTTIKELLSMDVPGPRRELVDRISRDLVHLKSSEARLALEAAGINIQQFEQLLRESKNYLIDE